MKTTSSTTFERAGVLGGRNRIGKAGRLIKRARGRPPRGILDHQHGPSYDPDWQNIRWVLAAWIRRWLADEGVSQRHLARLSGVPQPILSRFLAGEADLTLKSAGRLMQVMGIMLTPGGQGEDWLATDNFELAPNTKPTAMRRRRATAPSTT